MRIGIIHSGNAGFFPRFYKSLHDSITQKGGEAMLFVPNSGRNHRCILPNQTICGTRINWLIHSRLFAITGIQDVFSVFDTLCFIQKIKKYKPDLLHLHLINDKFLCLPLFVWFINRHNLPVVWTMHDCRAFTGGCPYFDEIGCNQWISGCGKCPQKETLFDHTHIQWSIRNKWHNKINNLVIVTPSKWLSGFVSNSMLRKHPCQVLYNGIDNIVFSRTSLFNVREKYNLSNQEIILGCAINWEKRKGLSYFEDLLSALPSNYQIVLVGGISDLDRKRLSSKRIILVGRTETLEEMVAWYQNASVFVNPTLADNFPTTNIESLASGTPVVTFQTGGSAECLADKCGIAVEKGNLEALKNAIIQVVENRDYYSSEECIKRSHSFSLSQFTKYVDLYEDIISK